jgi:4-amino-4-deoxy-L-arabinose transferase-like glycosyltransferase
MFAAAAACSDLLRSRSRLTHVIALTAVAGSAALRLAYLLHDCPLDLAPDEAHYWDWSRRLDWSYYSKGPVVAYLIRAGCEVFGPWSRAWTGTEMAAVRLPAVLCGGLTLLGLYVLTRRVYRNDGLALGVVLAALTLPVLAAGSLLMTIDAPYVCCWTWALVLAHRVTFASERGSPGVGLGSWALLGLVVGIGILAKYTMVLFPPSLLLFLLLAKNHRPLLRRSGFWLMCLLAGLCCLPILVWNARHGWVTFLHVGRQAGLRDSNSIRWLGPLEYVGGQAALLLGFWFVAWVLSVVRCPLSVGKEDDGPRATDHELFLWCLSVPMFLVFLAFSLKTKVELNWPVTAYLSGLVLTAGWLSRQCTSPAVWWRRLSHGTVLAASLLGLLVTVLMHHTEWLYPLYSPRTTHHSPLTISVRRWDPTCRLRGWQALAREVDHLRAELRADGVEPVLAASGWNLPGAIAFYLPDHPPVYSFALAAGGRHSQYDFWRPNPVHDPEAFRGRTVIYVGGLSNPARTAFATIEPSRQVVHQVAGLPVAAWEITVCRGFRGFPGLYRGGY